MKTVSEARSRLEQLRGRLLNYQQEIAELDEMKVRLGKRVTRIGKALSVIQAVATATQQQLQFRVSSLATTALQAIFIQPLELKLIFEVRRGQTEVRLELVEDGHGIDPLEACGIGAADVTSLSLRLSLWALQMPRTAPIFILDEPFKNLSRDMQQRASQVLHDWSKKLDIQMIIATHIPELIEAADKVFTVTKTKKRSVVSCP